MKKLVLVVLSIGLIATSIAQVKKPVPKSTKPAPKTGAAPVVLKNLADSAGYALGADVANSLLVQNMSKINCSLMTKGLNDVLDGKPALIDENESFMVLSTYASKMRDEQIKKASAKPGAKPAIVKVAAKPTATKGPLKTLADSAGYSLGVNLATSLKFQDMTAINRNLITRGLNDVITGKQSVIKKETCGQIVNLFANTVAKEKSIVVIAEGEAFLAKNKLRPEVKTTASGLQYEVLKEGDGIRPVAVDTFVAHYRGTLIDGTEFESSYNRGTPLTYPLTSVVPGWTEGLQLMTAGSKYKFFIPYQLAYGARGNPPTIPGGSALIFELELLEVKKKQ